MKKYISKYNNLVLRIFVQSKSAERYFIIILYVNTFNVYINGFFYGSDLSEILINTNDVLRIDITKKDNLTEASIKLNNELI